ERIVGDDDVGLIRRTGEWTGKDKLLLLSIVRPGGPRKGVVSDLDVADRVDCDSLREPASGDRVSIDDDRRQRSGTRIEIDGTRDEPQLICRKSVAGDRQAVLGAIEQGLQTVRVQVARGSGAGAAADLNGVAV